ncbi:FkbM family methyltransferase [Erythrobacteraceae bacterium CFH 75059]|uniref:FkbM family methyltransferase n=1 Tax=Qipengyuania thermophila TaxID=2509361 RepID=UPI00101E8D29|nr:FkbM family methyltransferase [Qipengyuania thermophila]TCD01899.1 FkbM family methyltransferase [Erythrobacteraceae bacterium CFH 75059]
MLKEARKLISALLANPDPQITSEESAYRRLADRGYSPKSIIDVGAHEGEWTRLAKRVFPEAKVLMCEASEQKAANLESICRELPNTTYSIAPLASEGGKEVTFYLMDNASSIMPENSNIPREEVRLTTKTLDDVASEMDGPIFLKIDVQGAELEVLKGGTETLRKCDVIQLEVAVLEYNRGAPDMRTVLETMHRLGFSPFDIGGLVRPDSINLVQIDLLFAKHHSPLRPTYFAF